MRINVVQGGSPQLFNAMLFPEATPETQAWLHEQWNRDTSMLTDLGRQFMNSATEYWKQLYDPMLMQRARSMMRAVGGMFHPNKIIYLEDIPSVQQAKPVMQRYIMAMPELRKLYHRQLCDGYSDSYVDHEPGLVGREHYDFRRVMNGIVVETEDGGWQSTMYPDELYEGDRELEVDEKFAILRGWDLVKAALGRKIDPTDIFAGDLEI